MSELLPISKPMKGVQVDDLSKLRFPLWAAPKIDGFRCILGQQPHTSRLGNFPNKFLHKALSGVLPVRHFLDGELVVGSRRGQGVLQRTSSGVTSQEGNPDFTLWVFDRPGLDYSWIDRHAEAKILVDTLSHPRIRLLRHTLITNLEELEEFIDDKLTAGYEGVMTRSAEGPWKNGKSTLREQYLLKIKPFVDAEGRVKGYFEEEANENEAKRDATGKLKRSSAKSGKVGKGRLGGLILEDVETRVEVRVGGGFSAQQRELLWPIRDTLLGRLVKYSKQATGEKDRPRHPNFQCFIDFRPDWDMS